MDDPANFIAIYMRPQQSDISFANNILQRYEDPTFLAADRARFDEPPPPYSEAGESTIYTDSPASLVEESTEERAPYQSAPGVQFKQQVELELERIWRQIGTDRWGRRLTLPYDQSIDARENARKNIQELWSKLGIWAEEWTPCYWQPTGFTIGLLWGHERSAPSSRSMSPEKLDPATVKDAGTEKSLFGAYAESGKNKSPSAGTANIETGLEQSLDTITFRKLTVQDRQASKPVNQFLAQLKREIEWLEDELSWTSPSKKIDIPELAHSEVKARWVKNGIWNSEWGDSELPGEAWAHEALAASRIRFIKSQHELNISKRSRSSKEVAVHATDIQPITQDPMVDKGLSRKRKRGINEGQEELETVKKTRHRDAPKVLPDAGISRQTRGNSTVKRFEKERSSTRPPRKQKELGTKSPPRRSARIAKLKAQQQPVEVLRKGRGVAVQHDQKFKGKGASRKPLAKMDNLKTKQELNTRRPGPKKRKRKQ